MKIRHAISLAACLSLSQPTLAADTFTDAMVSAYPAYRAALFRTNANAQTESEQAIGKARAAWSALIAEFGARPPAPYDRDPEFASTLAKVAEVFDAADTQIRDKQLAQAHETLEAARDLMADLRRRNGVVVYSDHMNAYHAEMEEVLGTGAALLDRPDGFMLLMAEVGKLEWLAGRLRTEAPVGLVSDPRFETAVGGVETSLAGLRKAVLAQDAAQVRTMLGNIKKPYARLFLEFG